MSHPIRCTPAAGLGLAGLLLLASACGDDNGPSKPTTGSIQVTVSTMGAPPDPDGFNAVLDPEADSAVANSVPAGGGSTTFSDVATGDHTVELQGVALNCVVTPTPSLPVTVVASDTAMLVFGVNCREPTPPAEPREYVPESW